MNKKLILVGFILTIFTNIVFAQEINTYRLEQGIESFTQSAKSLSTAGLFSSDSDNVNAKDIFDIKSLFFSAGYLPALSGAGLFDGGSYADGSAGTMSGFWAMPINDMMTVGFAGQYKMYASKTSSAIPVLAPDFPDSIDTTGYTFSDISTYENSAFNLRPVFRYGNYAFSYRISRGGELRERYYKTADTDGDVVFEQEVFTDTMGTGGSTSEWQHEIAVAYGNENFRLYLPVGVIIDNGGTEYSKYIDNTTPNTKTEVINTTDNKSISVYMSPEFYMPFRVYSVSLSSLSGGISLLFDVDSGGNSEKLSTYVDDVLASETYTTYENSVYIEGNIWFKSTFDWASEEGKLKFRVEPELGVNFGRTNDGDVTKVEDNGDEPTKSLSTSFTGIISPYLGANIGALIYATDWLELRTGLTYKLNWDNTIVTTTTGLYGSAEDEVIENEKLYTESSYVFFSEFYVYAGVGFTIVDNFFIDIFMQAGQDNLVHGIDDTGSTSLFDVNSYGIQLSYRF